MTDRELMQQALEGLEEWRWGNDPRGADVYIDALRERLAQPEQEPVAWEQFHEHMAGPFYKAPRPWVGLTDDELFKIWMGAPAETEDRFAFVKSVIATLKEKNDC